MLAELAEQLGKTAENYASKSTEPNYPSRCPSLYSITHHEKDVPVSVGGSQVERGVVAHVGRVDPRAAGDEHLDDLGVAALGRPVQRGELMVISA